MTTATAEFVTDVAEAAYRRWREPDHDIWEIRDEPRHFLHSKLMYWVALDRAVELAGSIGSNADRVSRWREERDEIRRAILEQGWSGRAGAFIQTFAGEALDASTLLLPIVGFLPADDERVRATVEAVAQRLTDSRGLVYKYKTEDGLEGRRARSCSAPSGYPTHSRSADSWTGPERCSSELRRMPTISVSWRKKSTALPASSWGTFPRP